MKVILFSLLIIAAPFAKGDMDEIPLSVTDSGHFSLNAELNGKEGTFILDTGATGSVVGLEKLTYFDIENANKPIDGVIIGDEQNGKIDTFPISIESLVIGSHKLTLSNIHSNSIVNLGPEIDGIIGHDAIVELKALIDIRKSRLLVPEDNNDVKAFLSGSSSTYTAIPLIQSEFGFSLIKARFENHDVVLLLDSGAGQVVLDQSVVADNLSLELKNHPKAKSINHDGTQTPMKVVLNKTLKIDSAEIKGDFLVADFGALKQAIGQKNGLFLGIMGNKELASINSIIDAANSVIYVRQDSKN